MKEQIQKGEGEEENQANCAGYPRKKRERSDGNWSGAAPVRTARPGPIEEKGKKARGKRPVERRVWERSAAAGEKRGALPSLTRKRKRVECRAGKKSITILGKKRGRQTRNGCETSPSVPENLDQKGNR